ncbi:MAG: hypothetical protein OHK0046_20020 [Anaerolineae bacterium]
MSLDETVYPPFEDEPTQPNIPRSRRRGRLIGFLLFVLVLVVLVVVIPFIFYEEEEPVTVTLQLGGITYPVTTRAKTVAEFLLEQNLSLEAGDILLPGVNTEVEPAMLIQLERARTVSITVDGQTTILRTTFNSPQDIINSAGVVLSAADEIYVDGQRASLTDLLVWPAPVTEITIYRPVAVEIVDGDETLTVRTTGDTVGEVLYEAGIALFLADSTVPGLNAAVSAGMQIVIDRSRPMTLIADGTRLEIRTTGQTVADALAEAGVSLMGLDYSIPSEGTEVLPGMSVRVIRVREELIEEEETLPFETVYQADAALPLDERSVAQAGANGIINRTVRVRYENEVEVSRVIESEIQQSQPQNQIINYGTQIVPRTIETPDGPLEYWRKFRMYATSYHPAALGGDNITATGRILTKGIVAIDPRIIPYSTNVYVEGYGVGVAADTGGPRSTPYWIDLGYDDANFEGWSRWVDVYVLTPVPGSVTYLLPQSERGGPIP